MRSVLFGQKEPLATCKTNITCLQELIDALKSKNKMDNEIHQVNGMFGICIAVFVLPCLSSFLDVVKHILCCGWCCCCSPSDHPMVGRVLVGDSLSLTD